MSKTRYIPINKGHADLDTPERIKEFHNKLATGWEAEYAEYRRLWSDLPAKRETREYPLLVDLELSSLCNLNCPMCPTASESYKKTVKKGLLDYELARKVIDEIAGKVYSLRLSLVGEPTLNPRFFDVIKYAKDHGIKEISFLTNGSKLNLEFFKKLVDTGADWVTLSVDGLNETYNSIRKPLKFNEIIKSLKDIKNYKDNHHIIKPVIKVQSIWTAIESDPSTYYETIAPLVDLVAFNPFIDFFRHDPEEEIRHESNFACPQLYQRIVICSDGNIKMCSNDEHRNEIIGNAEKESVHDVWHGEKLNKIRDIHNKKDGFLSIHTCSTCYLPRKTRDDDFEVSGRKIIVKNYV